MPTAEQCSGAGAGCWRFTVSRLSRGLYFGGIPAEISYRKRMTREEFIAIIGELAFVYYIRGGRYLMQTTENSEAILRECILQEGETPERMVHRVVHVVMDGCSVKEQDRISDFISELKFLPNSPCLMNAGTEIGQLCACFALPVGDSMESIFEAIKNMALVQKSGGGTGFSFSRLRPEGDKVKSTGGIASGPVSFLKIFNAATEEVKQGGRRRGASLATLNVNHPDIMRFIHCKQDTGQITNFNLSVAITDEFMQAVKDDDEFALVNPRDGEAMQVVKARHLWDEITQGAWETGEPGLLFLDTINTDNPTPELGRIETCNPCGEVPLLPYEACVLGSINLSKFVRHGNTLYIDFDALSDVIFAAVRFLDNVIDVSTYPLPEIEQMTKANRKIGLGVMGWADMLYKLGVPYDSEEAISLVGQVMGYINAKAIEASEALALERGAFPNFDQSIYKDDKPRRNAAVTSIAPTGTLADIALTTYGIEPEYALVYTKRMMDGQEFTYVNSVFEAALKERGLYSDLLIEKIKANRGSIQGMTGLPQDLRDIFKVAHDIAPEWHVRMQAAFQEHVEQSISKTINLPESATVQDVADAYVLAWETGCKGITVYRDNARPQQVLSTKYLPSERPDILEGRTHKFATGCGSLYVTVNRDLAGGVHEVFTAHSKNNGCVAALLNALSRVVSIALRSGVAPEAIIKTTLGQDCGQCEGISSCADAVGRALRADSHAQQTDQVQGFCEAAGGSCQSC